MFKVLRNYCGFKVNDVSKSNYPPKRGQRVRYYWVCSKRNCKPCSESICPAIKKIAAKRGFTKNKEYENLGWDTGILSEPYFKEMC
jgi:hypothetical protein